MNIVISLKAFDLNSSVTQQAYSTFHGLLTLAY